MNPSTREIRVRIDSRLEFIDLIQRMAEKVARAAGFGRGTVLNVGLAVREAAINAIKHGNRQERGKRIEIIYRLNPDRLVVAVRDQGSGFDFEKLGDPLDPQNIFRPYGRGVFFMRSFVDKVAFNRLNGGGTEVRMEKRIKKRRRTRRRVGTSGVSQGGGVG